MQMWHLLCLSYMSKEKLKSLFDFTCLFTLLLILELRLLRREKGKVYVWLSLEMSVLHQQQLRVLWHCPICLSDWNRQPLKKGTAEHGLSISAGICCLEPFIKIITQLCISLQPLSLSHPSVRVHHWWSRVKLRRVQTWTWRSFTQYVTCLLCLYPKSTSELLCSFILDLSLSLDSFFLSVLLVSCWRDNMSFFFFLHQMSFCVSLAFPILLSTFVPQEQSATCKAQSSNPYDPVVVCVRTYTLVSGVPVNHICRPVSHVNRLIRGYVLMIRGFD